MKDPPAVTAASVVHHGVVAAGTHHPYEDTMTSFIRAHTRAHTHTHTLQSHKQHTRIHAHCAHTCVTAGDSPLRLPAYNYIYIYLLYTRAA